MHDFTNTGAGPYKALTNAASTGPGTTLTLGAPRRKWGLQVVTGNSTSTVKVKVVLQGSLDTSTAPKWVTMATWTSTGGAQTNGDIVNSTGDQLAHKVRARVDSAPASTSSTAPNASVYVGGI